MRFSKRNTSEKADVPRGETKTQRLTKESGVRKERISTRWFQLFSGVRVPLMFWLFAFLVAALEKQRTGFVVVETSSAYREPLLLGVELQ
jgi:hypothetical protein